MSFYKSKNQLFSRLIDKIVVKNDDSYVERSFYLPELIRTVIKCKDSGIISILNGVVHGNIMQCLNAGDIKGAVSNINQDNIDTEHNIIKAVKQGLNIKLNNINVEMRTINETMFVNVESKDKKTMKLEKEKQWIEKKMHLIEQRVKDNDLCTICLETQVNKTITKCCNNSFCLGCLTLWLKSNSTCPLCKSNMRIENDLFVVKENDYVKEKCEPTKMQQFNTMLTTFTSSTKMLIFSEFDNSFIDIESALISHGINFARLKGNAINKHVNDYKNCDLQVLLVNSHAYGSGLNLENTTDVVLFHKFDNDLETQIIGRAQRPGRTVPLNVWYLLNNNEIVSI